MEGKYILFFIINFSARNKKDAESILKKFNTINTTMKIEENEMLKSHYEKKNGREIAYRKLQRSGKHFIS